MENSKLVLLDNPQQLAVVIDWLNAQGYKPFEMGGNFRGACYPNYFTLADGYCFFGKNIDSAADVCSFEMFCQLTGLGVKEIYIDTMSNNTITVTKDGLYFKYPAPNLISDYLEEAYKAYKSLQ